MSRSDYPPGYDESGGPPYNPQGGNYPAPPAYGFPAYNDPHPGQPTAPYPTNSGTLLYPGQPAGTPAGSYPGQPQPSGPTGAGYAPMPPIVPPTIPMDMMSSDVHSDEEFGASDNWDSLKVRHAFIRKVYLILASQLLVTTGIVAVFIFVDSVRLFVQRNQAVYWASYGVYFVTHMVLVCCKGPRRKFPCNLILLLIVTLALSYMTGTISSFYETKAVFLALGITVVVCVIVTVFCFQTKVDLTKCRGLFCVLGIVVFVTGIITTVVLWFKYIYWLHMLFAALSAIVFTMFLAYHTQLLIGNRKYSISPEEYVFGALAIYSDIMQIFLALLQILGSSD